MAVDLVKEGTKKVGKKAVLEGPSPKGRYVVIFEDDGETGYLYGLDTTQENNPICDALHIYNVASVTDRNKPSLFQLVWSQDGLKAALLINKYPHAVFDFEAKRGYCRTGFPPPNKNWTNHTHDWDDVVNDLFA